MKFEKLANTSIYMIISHLLTNENETHKRLIFLLGFMILAGVLEVVSIGLVIPFIGIVTGAKSGIIFGIDSNKLGMISDVKLIFLIFVSFTLVASFFRIILVKKISQISFSMGNNLGELLYANLINQKYEFIKYEKSSDLIVGLSKRVDDFVYLGVMPMLTIASSIIIGAFIIGTVLIIDYKVALFISIPFILIYITIIQKIKKEIVSSGEVIERSSRKILELLQETHKNIREIILENIGLTYKKNYTDLDRNVRDNQVSINVYANSPRFIIEAFGMVFIAIAAYLMKGNIDAISILAAMALAAQRLLPIMQQSYNAFINLKGGNESLRIVEKYLKLKSDTFVETSIKPGFIKVSLDSVSLKKGGVEILKNISLDIVKGNKIAFIGESGSGKSSLVELIIGLTEPTSGVIKVNGSIDPHNNRGWWSHLAYLSQDVYLTDSTILENITLSKSYDESILDNAIEKSKLDKFIKTLKDGIHSKTGENGVNLSGGQRQRIALARAIYKGRDILILDEPTSALDPQTEKEIYETVLSLGGDQTVIFITHNTEYLSKFDATYELISGVLKRNNG
ncbi:ABC transporter ATP-binding protein [Polynucleobacter paneuropaeus]|nr:ABC transporter ATP-binding protein [Polynucleobacter paneuropaeus]